MEEIFQGRAVFLLQLELLPQFTVGCGYKYPQASTFCQDILVV